MGHPFIERKQVLTFYFVGSLVLAALQVIVLISTSNLAIHHSIADGIVYATVFAMLGFGFRYPLAYADKTKDRTRQIINNVLVFVVFVGMWLILSYFVMTFFSTPGDSYNTFAKQIFPLRLLWGSVLFLLLGAIYQLIDFYLNLEDKHRQEEVWKKLVKEAELKLLKSQLSPHFLFNSLNSISSLTITDQDAAREMINKLSDFLRYSLKKSDNLMLPLKEELRNMTRYLDIEKVRFGDRIQYELEIEGDCHDKMLPAMILQPLYENAVKHGVYESLDAVTIRTFCRCHENSLEISIINNYEASATSIKGEGIGLENIKHRLRTVFQADGLMTINRENGFFEACILIPQLENHMNNELQLSTV